MLFTSRRWDVTTIIARVRASNALTTAHLDPASRTRRTRELRRIARAVDAGRLSNPTAAAAFTRLADELDQHPPG